jgi:hypothetical protein
MSRDQKPGKATIVVNAKTQEPKPAANVAAEPPPPVLAIQAKPPVALLSGLFIAACIISGVGFVVLPGLLR